MSDVSSPRFGFHDRFLERLRLQFLASGNWKAALANSDLPEDVTMLIHDVVQETGLLRFEKSEITTELIHHFQDGHDRGHSFDELVRDFGTADVAVSLFRSSKLRSRPMSIKAFRGSMIAFGGGLISYLMLQLFFHSAKPNPNMDFGEELNKEVTSMPIEEQAWPLYREVWTKHGLTESAGLFDELWFEETHRDAPEVEWFDENKSLRPIRPGDEGWDKAVAKLESLKELLEVFRKGSRLPYLGTPLHMDRRKYSDADLAALFPNQTREEIEQEDSSLIESFGIELDPVSKEAEELLSGSTFGILLPHIQQFRRAGRLLRIDTRYAMEQGDHDRAVANVESIFGLGSQAGKNPIVVCQLVGLAVRGIGFNLIEELITEHLDSLTDSELQRLQELAANVDFTKSVDVSFERRFVMDFIQRIYSDDGNGDGRMTAIGMEVQYVYTKMLQGFVPGVDESKWHENSTIRSIAGPVSLFTAPSRKQMESLVEETFDELESRINHAMWEDREFEYDMEDKLNERDGAELLSTMITGLTRLKLSREIKIARRDAVVLALACHRYMRANENWPTALNQLNGKWLESLPVDRLNGKPLSFSIKEDSPVVYSLGHDGDDDDGVSVNSTVAWMDRDGDGDWILWPIKEQ
jgi:hypothetical protein